MTDLSALSDELVVPLLDTAAATLRALAADDVPAAARSLLGFDRRGLTRGPARRQLRRALEDDASFREQVFTVFCLIPEVQAAVEHFSAADALASASIAAENGELDLLACALVAAAPEGAEFGLGVVLAVAAARRGADDEQKEATAVAARLAEVEEARRRTDAERTALARERDELAEQLKTERRARRAREDDAATAAAGVDQRVAELEAQAARECARAERAEAERRRADARAAERDAELESLRRAAPSVPGVDADAIGAAARAARQLAETLDGLASSDAERAIPSVPVRATGAAAAPRRDVARSSVGRRIRPTLPGGLMADSVAGADAMLRSAAVLLIVDGYNVSKTAGSAASLAVERESLVRALEAFHLTSGVQILVVFDGDGTPAFSKATRRGVRVLFSRPEEEADSVVVEIVASTPLDTPVVVASSDRWVREHAETFGAVVVSAATLLGVLRRKPAR